MFVDTKESNGYYKTRSTSTATLTYNNIKVEEKNRFPTWRLYREFKRNSVEEAQSYSREAITERHQ